ncbi:unnamed protein product [Parajaminaea phylloscopi]
MPVVQDISGTTFRERAARDNLSDAALLNSNNSSSDDADVDVAVVGGGIHGLIYAIHARCFDPKVDRDAKMAPRPLRISLYEKSPRPAHKIGESTLPPFSLWMKMLGFSGSILLRIFGMKDGLNFYTFDKHQQGAYSEFASNGPPALFLAGFQVERPISELLLTLIAQRRGINVFHGHQVDVRNTTLSNAGNVVPVIDVTAGSKASASARNVQCPLVIDGTGRFRQFSSKASKVHRFEGFNTDAVWAYFTCNDEANINIRDFEGPNTNHLCFPEGWAWVIRLPSWQGSPLANLMDMMTFLIDHAEKDTAGDDLPSMTELAEMFGCKVRWVWSIGYALRDDIPWKEARPSGVSEAEHRFWTMTNKYTKLREFMTNFELIPDLYGPGTTWTIRKALSFHSNVASGDGWAAVGDALGFTNPLHSPGISAMMGATGLAAETTHRAFRAHSQNERRLIWADYERKVLPMVPSLDLMNRFNYVCFRHPSIPPRVCFLFQYAAGVGNPGYQWIRAGYSLTWDNWTDYITHWLWGSLNPEYIAVARHTLALLGGPYTDEAPSDQVVDRVIKFSEDMIAEMNQSNRFNFRWAGLLRFYDADLRYDGQKRGKDRFAKKCPACRQWHALRADWHHCYNCGVLLDSEEREIEWDPPLQREEVTELVSISDSKALGKAMAIVNATCA